MSAVSCHSLFDRHLFVHGSWLMAAGLKMSTTKGSVGDAPKPETPILVTLTGDEGSGETNRTFVFNNEGHTLGNALRSILSRNPEVEFCGYTVPHPAECKMSLRIQTRGPPAADLLKQALADLAAICDRTLGLFQEEVTDFKAEAGER